MIMGWSLLIGGIVMWMVDAMNAKSEAAGPGAPGSRIHTWKMEDMSLAQAIWIGFCQIFSAVFPGTSRSMSTIAGGQIVGMSRAAALEFSFFLSMPTMAAATLYTLLKSLSGKGENPIGVSQIDAHGWIVLAIGFVVSFLVAYGFGRLVHGATCASVASLRLPSTGLSWERWCWCSPPGSFRDVARNVSFRCRQKRYGEDVARTLAQQASTGNQLNTTSQFPALSEPRLLGIM